MSLFWFCPWIKSVPGSPISCNFWRLASDSTWQFFADILGNLHLLSLITGNFNSVKYNPLVHWFDTYLQVLWQQISNLNCVQWLPRKCTTKRSRYVEIHFVYNYLYKCSMNFVYIIFLTAQNLKLFG